MKIGRLIIGIFFILIILLLCYIYTSNQNYNDSSVINLLHNNSENQIFILGSVTQIYNDGFEVYVNKNGKVYHVITTSKANLGNYAYILGTLNSNNEIIANKIIINKGDETINVILRSIFGLIIFLLIFMRFWKFNPQKMLFIRRK